MTRSTPPVLPRDAVRHTAAAALSPAATRRQNLYCWLVLLGTLDVILTTIVLHFGGAEINPIAAAMVRLAGHWGLIALKFPMVIVVVVICEFIAARRESLSNRLASWGVGISTVPLVLAAVQLTAHAANQPH